MSHIYIITLVKWINHVYSRNKLINARIITYALFGRFNPRPAELPVSKFYFSSIEVGIANAIVCFHKVSLAKNIYLI